MYSTPYSIMHAHRSGVRMQEALAASCSQAGLAGKLAIKRKPHTPRRISPHAMPAGPATAIPNADGPPPPGAVLGETIFVNLCEGQQQPSSVGRCGQRMQLASQNPSKVQPCELLLPRPRADVGEGEERASGVQSQPFSSSESDHLPWLPGYLATGIRLKMLKAGPAASKRKSDDSGVPHPKVKVKVKVKGGTERLGVALQRSAVRRTTTSGTESIVAKVANSQFLMVR